MKITSLMILSTVLNYEKIFFEERCFINLIKQFVGSSDTTLFVSTEANIQWNIVRLFSEKELVFLRSDYSKSLKNQEYLVTNLVYVVEFSSFDEIRNISHKLKKHTFWNFKSKFVLIYFGKKEEKHIIKQWIQDMWSFSVYDTIFLTFSSPTPKLYMWYPYSSTFVEKNFCRMTQEFKKNLAITQVPKIFIPNPLKVRMVVRPPYVINKNSGSDIVMTKEIAKILHTELVLSHSDIPLDFGYRQPNGTITGAFGAVYYHKADLAIGGFLINQDRYRLLDISCSYYTDRRYWCVSRATKIPSWKQVFITMNLET
ncbi:hypothetical protein Zmor_007562 [Zophobas morio]|uniref:Uncharacterized protein n=1 Tax=Zophobas morio TaxID=2755281 RepID=A0AA38IYF5_9CUCU|nr:hypothetical protein Zmor_007562 [Zophobas morio]